MKITKPAYNVLLLLYYFIIAYGLCTSNTEKPVQIVLIGILVLVTVERMVTLCYSLCSSSKEKKTTESSKAKFLIAKMKLEFFDDCLNSLSSHERALAAILSAYQEINEQPEALLAAPKNYAEKMISEYDLAEECFAQFISFYQAKRNLVDDRTHLLDLETSINDLSLKYQDLLNKVGISRLFMERNTKGQGTDLELQENGTRYLRNGAVAFEEILREYVDSVRSVIILFQDLSKTEIQNLNSL